MWITVELDRVLENGSIESRSRVGHHIVDGLDTYEQVYEWCIAMIMRYVPSDYCDMRIYLWGELFMDVDLSLLRRVVEG